MNIGYYAHHHGSGHCRQADKLAGLLPNSHRQNLVVFTSLSAQDLPFSNIDESKVVRLAAEDELDDDVIAGRAGAYFMPDSLHYSPVGNPDIQDRSWQLLEGIRRFDIKLMIIDVSAEVAMLCRAASIPYLYVRLAGIRDDTPHLNAFSGALGLIAPYPKALEAKNTPDWVCQKTLYLGFLSPSPQLPPRFEDFVQQLTDLANEALAQTGLENQNHQYPQQKALIQQKIIQYQNQHSGQLPLDRDHQSHNQTPLITVIKGFGGHQAIDDKLTKLRALWPQALIVSLGPIDEDKRLQVDIAATVNDVTPFLAFSDYLLMACGLNAVAQAYPYQTPLIALFDDRPHDEQKAMATALIDDNRAMSWEQFVQYSKAPSENQTLLPSFEAKASLNDSEAMPLALMSSLASTVTVKSWFESWLLPKLLVRPQSS